MLVHNRTFGSDIPSLIEFPMPHSPIRFPSGEVASAQTLMDAAGSRGRGSFRFSYLVDEGWGYPQRTVIMHREKTRGSPCWVFPALQVPEVERRLTDAPELARSAADEAPQEPEVHPRTQAPPPTSPEHSLEWNRILS